MLNTDLQLTAPEVRLGKVCFHDYGTVTITPYLVRALAVTNKEQRNSPTQYDRRFVILFTA
jgi:hypothetical protein